MKYQTGWVALAVCATIFACASPGTSGGSSGQIIDRVRVSGTSDPNEMVTYTNAGPTSANAILEFPAARIWELLPSAYSVLSIPITGIDSVKRIISGNIVARRVFSDRPLRTFVDCGSSLTGPNANTYSITMKLSTFVEPTGPAASRVRTVVDASGISGGGAQVRCSSSGDLELAILNRIQEGLTQ